MAKRQMLISVSDDGSLVTFCELTEKGLRQNIEKIDLAEKGVWGEWSNWMDPSRALVLIEDFLNARK